MSALHLEEPPSRPLAWCLGASVPRANLGFVMRPQVSASADNDLLRRIRCEEQQLV